jgi:GST-like protein
MYTLYGSKGSGSAAIEMALERCKTPYKLVRASSWEPESALADLERINPLKQIPTLVLPGGTVMSESAAILIHLGLVFPNAGLFVNDAARSARSLRGLVFIAANCYSAVSVSDFPERWNADPDDLTNERVRQAARAQLYLHWEIFADLFDGPPYLEGAAPGALDFLTVVASKWSGTRAHLKLKRPKFLDTLLRIEMHPDVAPVVARHWNALGASGSK